MALTPDEIRENKALSALAIVRANEAREAAARSHRILVGVLIAAVVIVGAFIRYGMRRQEREDAARAGGYRDYSEYETEADREARSVRPTDEYSSGVGTFADEMCRCNDKQCARDVRARLSAYRGRATDDLAQRSVDASLERLYTCAAVFEK